MSEAIVAELEQRQKDFDRLQELVRGVIKNLSNPNALMIVASMQKWVDANPE